MQDLIGVYRELAGRCDYALHVGLTEAGMGDKGVIASTAALAILLDENIGDTIRISLTPEPGSPRSREVKVAQQILQCLDKRSFSPTVVACPGCGRTSSDFFQVLAQRIQLQLDQAMPQWRSRYPGVEKMNVAVMGCVVNGPGESKEADIGVAGGHGVGIIFKKGELYKKVPEDQLLEVFIEEVEAMAKEKESTNSTSS